MANPYNNYIKNINLKSSDTKNIILNYLYKSNININLKPCVITSEKDLDTIRDNDYMICPRVGGSRVWVLFFTTNDIYYAVSFPKHSQTKKEILRIHPIDIRVRKELYRGTIMEGIYNADNEKKYIIIDEVYMIAGEDQRLKSKENRIEQLEYHIKKSITTDVKFSLLINQFYHINQESLKNLYDKIKSDPSIQEIIFYPKIYGQKIFSYTILDTDLIDDIIKISPYRMKKTSNPDVYNLYLPTKNTKIGIAYIPNIEISKICKQWFKTYKTDSLLVKCKLDNINKKWIPIEIIESDIDSISDSLSSAKSRKI